MNKAIYLDCTLRDGGYYNNWDFTAALIRSYLAAMKAAQVDVVELGFRFLGNSGFKGACAYTTDDFIRSLDVPEGLTVGVMINGADLLTDRGLEPVLELLFPETTQTSPVGLVRVACHYHELARVLPAVAWLVERGYRVGVNLMQVSERTEDELRDYAIKAGDWPVEVLYFADSTGGMSPDDVTRIIGGIRKEWQGPIGVHTHDNMGMALQNTLRAQQEGASWFDATVAGMGRGPGNARTEELMIEAESLRGTKGNLVPLLILIRKYFDPMKIQYGWGTNPYYYLSGKFGIHPTYVQEMLGDPRYDEDDILAVIEQLRLDGGSKFSSDRLVGARNFYTASARGTWSPCSIFEGRDVLVLGTGPGVETHRPALEALIRRDRPLVLALNTQSAIAPGLIDLRAACHPFRLMADCEMHVKLPQPLITPASMLSADLKERLRGKELLDFGLRVEPGRFGFGEMTCLVPSSLVLAYALAVAASGKAKRILMAGFDGYPAGDPRNAEMNSVLAAFFDSKVSAEIVSILPTAYNLPQRSVYGM